MPLNGLEIVIAGGSGGLGSATAEHLRNEGATVFSGSRANGCDITTPEGRAALLGLASSMYGLVVFTGISGRAAASWDESLDINYTGPILLAREAAERMRQRRVSGAIVLIATMQTVGLFPGSTIYAGAKAALVHAGRILAKECRGPGELRVNIVSPGVMDAGMGAVSIESGKYRKFLDSGSVARWGQAADVSRAVRFLLEPDCYITGQHLVVDGGLNL